uniref:Methyltransferase FkbM domain-containing protein n=1 Tax=viral metagenome TaxID=1070528 RepID=A0A6C0JPJ9_9ZZZZ
MNEQSYSLNDNKQEPIDKKLDKIFGKSNGVYIELGANNGLLQSNTAFFDFYRNWSGILIEPDINAYNLCKINRPKNIVLNYCCVSNDYVNETIKGDFTNSNLMASVNGERLNSQDLVEVESITLDKVFETYLQNKKVDLISIDTEGYEYNVLLGLNLNKNRPKYFLIEIYDKDYEKILNYLINNNYCLHSNFSNYNKNDNIHWDGTHNDFLFYDNLT